MDDETPRPPMVGKPIAGDFVVKFRFEDYPDVKSSVLLQGCNLTFDENEGPPISLFVDAAGSIRAIRIHMENYVIVPKATLHGALAKCFP